MRNTFMSVVAVATLTGGVASGSESIQMTDQMQMQVGRTSYVYQPAGYSYAICGDGGSKGTPYMGLCGESPYSADPPLVVVFSDAGCCRGVCGKFTSNEWNYVLGEHLLLYCCGIEGDIYIPNAPIPPNPPYTDPNPLTVQDQCCSRHTHADGKTCACNYVYTVDAGLLPDGGSNVYTVSPPCFTDAECCSWHCNGGDNGFQGTCDQAQNTFPCQADLGCWSQNCSDIAHLGNPAGTCQTCSLNDAGCLDNHDCCNFATATATCVGAAGHKTCQPHAGGCVAANGSCAPAGSFCCAGTTCSGGICVTCGTADSVGCTHGIPPNGTTHGSCCPGQICYGDNDTGGTICEVPEQGFCCDTTIPNSCPPDLSCQVAPQLTGDCAVAGASLWTWDPTNATCCIPTGSHITCDPNYDFCCSNNCKADQLCHP
jgi:hypothetical protein